MSAKSVRVGDCSEILPAVIARLSDLYKVERQSSDPFHHILWENVGYLIDDVRRWAIFEEFRSQIGFDAAAILTASDARLLELAQKGGMNPEARAERWRRIAEIIQQECKNDLAGFLKSLQPAKARSFLKRFPAIGDPGADKILLFCGLDLRPGVDSNGLRVLVRLGLVPRAASYAATYKSAAALLSQFSAQGREWLVSCHLLLREHGRALCRRSDPRCMVCPLDGVCAHAPAKGL